MENSNQTISQHKHIKLQKKIQKRRLINFARKWAARISEAIRTRRANRGKAFA